MGIVLLVDDVLQTVSILSILLIVVESVVNILYFR